MGRAPNADAGASALESQGKGKGGCQRFGWAVKQEGNSEEGRYSLYLHKIPLHFLSAEFPKISMRLKAAFERPMDAGSARENYGTEPGESRGRESFKLQTSNFKPDRNSGSIQCSVSSIQYPVSSKGRE